MELLVCLRCGAPLPAPTTAIVTCAYCGVSASRSASPPPAAAPTSPGRVLAPGTRAAFCQELAAALQAGRDPHEALTSTAAAHLGRLGETDAMARVVLALAAEFERETGASVVGDGVAMARLAEAYFAAIESIRTTGSYDVNLPFLAATSSGPRHFVRTLTAEGIASLVAAGAPAPKKKWAFWPFGRG